MRRRGKEWTIPEFNDRVIERAQTILDEFGEWGNQQTELGIIRKARFAMPNQDATLRVHEVVDPHTLSDDKAPLAYNLLRDDWRGSYDILLTVRAELGARALMTLDDDLTINPNMFPGYYATEENADEYNRRFGNGHPAKPTWPQLVSEGDFPSSPRIIPHRSTLTSKQYKAGLKWHSRGKFDKSFAKLQFDPQRYLPNLYH